MIDYLYINNYKSFVNFKIKFDEKSLLIGVNGAGKTSILIVAASLKTFISMILTGFTVFLVLYGLIFYPT